MKTTSILYIHPFWAISPSDSYPMPHLPWGIGVAAPIIQDNIIFNPVFTQQPKGVALLRNFLVKKLDESVLFNVENMARDVAISTRYATDSPLEERLAGNFALSYDTAKAIVKSYIEKYRPDIVCMSLHWLVHVVGLIRIAQIIKDIDEEIKIVVGGITASVFFDEILKVSKHIDFVIRGDGCRPLLKLIKCYRNGKPYDSVPNTAYRTKRGVIKKTPAVRYNDADMADEVFDGFVTFARCCTFKCCMCGASWYAAKKFLNYDDCARMSPDAIIRQLKENAEEIEDRRYDRMECNFMFNHDPVLLYGKRRWLDLTRRIRREKIRLKPYIEFFAPTTQDIIDDIAKTFPESFVLNFSPESINRRVRNVHGRTDYENEDLIKNIEAIEKIPHGITNLWFMMGLGFDTKSTIRETLDFCRAYASKKTIPHYPPLLYVDPGSLAWNFPGKYGYRSIDRDLSSIIRRLSHPYGLHHFNFTTKYFSRRSFWHEAIDTSKSMAEILLPTGQISMEDKIVIDKFNNLLSSYEQRFNKLSTFRVRDIDIYNDIGMSFLNELYS